MIVAKTDRLLIRELDAEADAEFVHELLNTPAFLHYIGDRGVRSVEQARAFVEDRYRASYREHGYGLYLVALRNGEADRGQALGLCGFVKRDHLEHPDIGFAFLPEFERRGFGFESADAMLKLGRESLGFQKILAITSQDNDSSGKLLIKLGFAFTKNITSPEGEVIKLYEITL